MRGKFLTLVIILEFLLLFIGAILVLSSQSFGSTRLPNWLNIVNLTFTVVLSSLGLVYMWRMKKMGVYLFFLPFLWTTPLTVLLYSWGEISQKGLIYSLTGLIIFIIGPLGLALARKWKYFE